MTELELRRDTAPIIAADPTGGRLIAWAQAASAANQLAKALCQTSFVPAGFKGNDGDATAVILMGDEIGLSPLASLRGIYIFKGTPALYARTMRALALSHGHAMWNEVSTDTEVVVCGQRCGSSNIERVSWTITRATKAGYTNNQKYKTDPQAMLQAKADSEVARKIAADVLAGVPHSVEDLELAEQPTTTVTRNTTAPKTVRRKTAQPEPAPEPEFEAEPEAQPEPEAPALDLINDAQLKLLHTLFTEHGFTDRDDRLDYVRTVLDAEVASSKLLTKVEASRVIDALQQLDGAE